MRMRRLQTEQGGDRQKAVNEKSAPQNPDQTFDSLLYSALSKELGEEYDESGAQKDAERTETGVLSEETYVFSDGFQERIQALIAAAGKEDAAEHAAEHAEEYAKELVKEHAPGETDAGVKTEKESALYAQKMQRIRLRLEKRRRQMLLKAASLLFVLGVGAALLRGTGIIGVQTVVRSGEPAVANAYGENGDVQEANGGSDGIAAYSGDSYGSVSDGGTGAENGAADDANAGQEALLGAAPDDSASGTDSAAGTGDQAGNSDSSRSLMRSAAGAQDGAAIGGDWGDGSAQNGTGGLNDGAGYENAAGAGSANDSDSSGIDSSSGAYDTGSGFGWDASGGNGADGSGNWGDSAGGADENNASGTGSKPSGQMQSAADEADLQKTVGFSLTDGALSGHQNRRYGVLDGKLAEIRYDSDALETEVTFRAARLSDASRYESAGASGSFGSGNGAGGRDISGVRASFDESKTQQMQVKTDDGIVLMYVRYTYATTDTEDGGEKAGALALWRQSGIVYTLWADGVPVSILSQADGAPDSGAGAGKGSAGTSAEKGKGIGTGAGTSTDAGTGAAMSGGSDSNQTKAAAASSWKPDGNNRFVQEAREIAQAQSQG